MKSKEYKKAIEMIYDLKRLKKSCGHYFLFESCVRCKAIEKRRVAKLKHEKSVSIEQKFQEIFGEFNYES